MLFVAGFLVGWLIDAEVFHLWPALGHTTTTAVDFVSGLLFAGGIGLAVSGARTFRRAKTAVFPNRDASALVTTGPYAATRNPMYMGMTLSYVGASLFVATAWPLLLLPGVVVALQRLVIDREERYLTQTFGQDYLAYQREVGRWW
jgi:protein-S-isoprenylcysteine O-methyltransferase Ste14